MAAPLSHSHVATQAPISLPHRNETATRVSHYLFFSAGGISRYTHELLTRIHEQCQVKAELVCLPSYAWMAQASYPVWPGLPEIGHRIALLRRMRFLRAQWRNPTMFLRRARETSAQVLHFNNINHLSYPLWKRQLNATDARIVATVHDVRRAKAIINRAHEDRQLREFYRRADALFVHSQAQARDLNAFSGVPEERIHIVPHGPYSHGTPTGQREELRERYGLPKDRRVALAFGLIRDEKNLDVLIKALASRKTPTHLVIAGRLAGRQHRPVAFYRELAASLGVAEDVTFLDRFIPDSEVADLFECCDWVALPYSQSFTSQSGVLNVAAQYRRPVILSGTCTFQEMLDEYDLGVLVAPDDVDALANGISKMTERLDSGHAHDFDGYLSRYSWEANARETARIYEELCR